ncbi:hypothetical protein ACHHYP_20768 [Achlya hypogyna]|uniref:Uncharacterized protein n=1 Tax=Achlya hypogyna TaxID=1202772 RepID=A0A1V9ZEW5_ACHHY|nr:hypothetical protein ACHHYP_20768 [Achlya hypogyna]
MEDLVRQLTKHNIALQLALAKARPTAAVRAADLGRDFDWLQPIKTRLDERTRAKKQLQRVVVKALRRRLVRVAMAFAFWIVKVSAIARPVDADASNNTPVTLRTRELLRRAKPPLPLTQTTAAPRNASAKASDSAARRIKSPTQTLSAQIETQRLLVVALTRQKARLEADIATQAQAMTTLETSQVALKRQVARLTREVHGARRRQTPAPPAMPPITAAARSVLAPCTTRQAKPVRNYSVHDVGDPRDNQSLHDVLVRGGGAHRADPEQDDLIAPLEMEPSPTRSNSKPSPPTEYPAVRFLGRRRSFGRSKYD